MLTDRCSLSGRSLNRITGIDPRARAARDVDQIREALLLQQTRGRTRAITARANDSRGFVFLEGQFVDTAVECRQRRIHRAWDVTVAVFRRTPHVDDLQVVISELFPQLVHIDLFDRIDRKSRLTPALYAAGEVTFHVLDADARETDDGFINV